MPATLGSRDDRGRDRQRHADASRLVQRRSEHRPAHYLGQTVIKAALERAKVDPAEVSEVILGQILTAGQGQNPARQASIHAGVPKEVPAYGVNILCGSGLKSVALGYQAILNGDSAVVVAGGQESMSMAPHVAHLRNGTKMGSVEFLDTMLKDGLMDAFQGYHMGTTAENVAQKWQITRDDQDKFAVASQNKAEAAVKGGRFKDEITPVTIQSRKGDVVVDTDEYPRFGATLDGMAKLRPGVQQGRHGDRRQCVGDQRRRRGRGPDVGRRGQAARPDAIGPDRLLGAGRRRSGDHGHRARSQPRARRWRRRAGRSTISTWSRPTRRSPPRRSRSTRTWAGTPAR